MTGDEKYDIGFYGTDSMSDEDVERILQITEQADEFEIMMMYFDCAMTQVRTKLEILNKEMALKNRRNPFEYIKTENAKEYLRQAEGERRSLHGRECGEHHQ